MCSLLDALIVFFLSVKSNPPHEAEIHRTENEDNHMYVEVVCAVICSW